MMKHGEITPLHITSQSDTLCVKGGHITMNNKPRRAVIYNQKKSKKHCPMYVSVKHLVTEADWKNLMGCKLQMFTINIFKIFIQ
uniref:Uncharacterized protein n=1 Tax=Anguilla anguilla TaxID=7936 RepID=A0A0E9TVK8_ANGAN